MKLRIFLTSCFESNKRFDKEKDFNFILLVSYSWIQSSYTKITSGANKYGHTETESVTSTPLVHRGGWMEFMMTVFIFYKQKEINVEIYGNFPPQFDKQSLHYTDYKLLYVCKVKPFNFRSWRRGGMADWHFKILIPFSEYRQCDCSRSTTSEMSCQLFPSRKLC